MDLIVNNSVSQPNLINFDLISITDGSKFTDLLNLDLPNDDAISKQKNSDIFIFSSVDNKDTTQYMVSYNEPNTSEIKENNLKTIQASFKNDEKVEELEEIDKFNIQDLNISFNPSIAPKQEFLQIVDHISKVIDFDIDYQNNNKPSEILDQEISDQPKKLDHDLDINTIREDISLNFENYIAKDSMIDFEVKESLQNKISVDEINMGINFDYKEILDDSIPYDTNLIKYSSLQNNSHKNYTNISSVESNLNKSSSDNTELKDDLVLYSKSNRSNILPNSISNDYKRTNIQEYSISETLIEAVEGNIKIKLENNKKNLLDFPEKFLSISKNLLFVQENILIDENFSNIDKFLIYPLEDDLSVSKTNNINNDFRKKVIIEEEVDLNFSNIILENKLKSNIIHIDSNIKGSSIELKEKNSITNQVREVIEKLNSSQDNEVRVILHPESLGELNIKINIIDEITQIEITAQKPDTLALLTLDAKFLETILNEAGIKINDSSLSFNLSNNSSNNSSNNKYYDNYDFSFENEDESLNMSSIKYDKISQSDLLDIII